VTDAECSGRSATTAQNEERVRELILQNRRVTVGEIAKQLNMSIGSANFVRHDTRNCSYIKCVPGGYLRN
jgi:predicted transcriptional regulator